MRHELIDPSKAVTVAASEHPLQLGCNVFSIEAGRTVQEIVSSLHFKPELHDYIIVSISGAPVPQEYWGKVRLKPGAHIEIRLVPKGPVAALLAVAVSAFSGTVATAILGASLASSVIFGSLTVGGLFAAAISTVGMMIVSAIAAPQSRAAESAMKSSPTYQDSPVFALSGSGNQISKWGAIPTVFGTYRAFPPLGAQYYTETVGNDQYLRMVVVWGFGPIEISDLKIGDTPIDQYDGVQIETMAGESGDDPLTLYPGTVTQTDLSIALTQALGFQTQRSATDADQISVEIAFPRGLVQYKDDGTREQATVTIDIQYRRVGDADWTVLAGDSSVITTQTSIDPNTGEVTQFPVYSAEAGGEPISGMSPEVVRHGFRFNLPSRGQYDVRIARLTADSTDSTLVDECAWTSLTTFTNSDPILAKVPLAKTALIIKASDQLNGVVDQLNGIVSMVAPDWDPNLESWVTRTTRSPAAAFRRALQYPGCFQPKEDSEIDLEALQNWSVFCASKGLRFNQYRDYDGAFWDLLTDIATAGRGSPALNNGKWSVVWDDEQSIPVQYFTPRNSWNFKGARQFPIVPHGYRVQFANENNGYAVDERIVYRDGYDGSNATIFEQMQPIGITDPDQIYKHARFQFAQALLRPEEWTIDCDFESLICRRGSLINIQHDVILIGLASGRITRIDRDGDGNIVGIGTDEECELQTGKTYAVEIRTVSSTKIWMPLLTREGYPNDLQFISALPYPASVGDLFAFGISDSVSSEALVTRIGRNADFGATITMVPYSRPVYTADSGAIPPYAPTISGLAVLPVPSNVGVVSDETVLLKNLDGTLIVRCQVTASPVGVDGATLEVQIRPSGGFAGWTRPKVDSAKNGSVIFEGVNQGEIYDISVRYTAPGRLPGKWSPSFSHKIVGKSSPPPIVDAINATLLASGDVRLDWDYHSAPLDWASINIYVRGALIHSGVTGYSFVLTDRIFHAVGGYYIEVSAVDTSGNIGPARGLNYFRSPPDPVDSVAVERLADGSHKISWVYAHPTVTAKAFNITVDGQVIFTGATGLEMQTQDRSIRTIGDHRVGVIVVDVDGFVSLPTEVIYTRPPVPAVTGFDIHPIGPHNYFTWDPSPIVDVAYYRIKYSSLLTGAAWLSATDFIQKVAAPATTIAAPEANGTFFIKAYDHDGNESVDPELIESNVDAVENLNFVALIDEGPTFPGTAQGCISTGSEIIMDADTKMSDWVTLDSIAVIGTGITGFYPQGLYTFANGLDLGDVYTARLTGNIVCTGSDLADTIASWENLTGVTTMQGANGEAWRAKLQCRTTSDDPAGSPTWSDWQDLVVGDYTLRGAEFRLILWSDLPTTTPVVTGLSVSVDMADRVISDNDLSCPSGGMDVTFDNAFKVIPAVGIAGQDMNTGDYFRITAKAETGFHIQFFNNANVGVARTFDWIAKGFGKVASP